MMVGTDEILYEDVVGSSARPVGVSLSRCGLDPCVASALTAVYGADITLSPPQVEALNAGLLEGEGHFIISAPTNSGKTLIALLRIFHRLIRHGGRHVFVVPLKALAEEKSEELRAVCHEIEASCGRKIQVAVSTGDYKLTGDLPDTPPPEKGEVLVCTPERLEVILRNPDNYAWAKSVDTFVMDEFHLLGDATRGARFEILVARLLGVCNQSSILALSATIGELGSIQDWLGAGGRTVQVVDNAYRYPQLKRQLIRTEEKDQFILNAANGLAPNESLLVFVYRKMDTENLARLLEQSGAGQMGIAYFHAGMSLAERREIGRRYRDRAIRVLVATTSLKMGVNTPASKVIIRDPVFRGVGKLGLSDALQMLGRAGRGDSAGEGIVLLSAKENYDHLLSGFQTNTVEALQPRLIPKRTRYPNSKTAADEIQPLRTALLSELASRSDARLHQLSEFLMATYSGHCLGIRHVELSQHIQALIRDKLIYQVENSEDTYVATRLGRTVSQSGLSAETGGMLGGFIRALIQMGQKAQESGEEGSSYLRRLSAFDLLIMACACYEARNGLLPVKSKDISDVIEFIEQLPPDEKPLLNLWRDATSAEYPTRRLLASLRLSSGAGSEQDQQTQYYRLLRTGMMLYQHAHGLPVEQLAASYGVYPGEFENQQKGQITWVLNGIGQICSSNKCYKLDFLAMRVFELIEDLTLGAGIGKLMEMKGFGRRSAEKLVSAGIKNMQDPRLRSAEALGALGLSAGLAGKITQLVARSSR